MDKNEIYSALGLAAGAAGVKIVQIFLRPWRRKSEGAALRAELRGEIKLLNERMSSIHYELGVWKKKYYELAEENAMLKGKCHALEVSISEILKAQRRN